MVVLAIFGVMGCILGARFFVQAVRDNHVRQNLRSLQMLWVQYLQEHGSRPPTAMADLFYSLEISPEKVLSDPVTGRPEVAAYQTIPFPTTLPQDEHQPMFVYQAGHKKSIVRFDGSAE